MKAIVQVFSFDQTTKYPWYGSHPMSELMMTGPEWRYDQRQGDHLRLTAAKWRAVQLENERDMLRRVELEVVETAV